MPMTRIDSPFQAFAASAARDPAAPFALAPASAGLAWAQGGFRLTYGDAAAAVADLARRYRAAGWGRGDRVALLLENRPEFLLHWLALNALGVSAVPLNGAMKPAELAHQMRVSGAGAVIAAPGFAALLAEGAPGVPVAGPDDAPPPGPGIAPPEGGRAEDEAALLFTSGSTGLPKACVLSNGYFMNVAEWYVSMRGVAAMTPGAEVALTPLPFFHMNALGCTAVGMMLIGGAIVPLDRFHPGRWWATVADSGATVVHALGVIPAILLGLPAGPQDRAHRARFAFAPGVAPEHRAAFTARFGLPLVDGWAMTETGGAAITDTAGLPEPLPPRCIGRPRAGMDWRIVDEAGRDVPPGTAGELLVRSAGADARAGFFSGYLGDPGATEAAWACGWFHTGDVMRADAEGLLYFVDRRKSIVRRSGENISALEVEAALAADPAVAAAAVTPVADPQREEEVFAFIVPAAPVEPEALLRRLAARLSYHKLPGYIACLEALPVGATAKVQRGQVRADAEAAVAGGTAIDLRGLKAKLRVEA
jgi:acyl-CoA synthetase (AMP-forming)/AMP-acid ligase II